MKEDWLGVRKAAKYLGVHYTTLRRWADQGKLASYRTPGGHRRFQQEDLDQFLNQHKEKESSIPSLGLVPHQWMVSNIGHSSLRQETWYGRLDEVQKTAMRADGREMMAVLMQYSTRIHGGEAFLEEGKRLAKHYSEICMQVGLSLVETARGFTIVRRSISDAVLKAGSIVHPSDSESWRLYERMNGFLDTMLLAMIQAYQDQFVPPAG